MKNINHIAIFIIINILIACQIPSVQEEDTQLDFQIEEMIKKIPEGKIDTIIIDKCQYIIYKEQEGINRGYGYMTHKGNCINQIHAYND